ncbi:MAG: DinB family protein [Cytophagales bacterium]|nr:DinB family protein [Cytophagales bacterium]
MIDINEIPEFYQGYVLKLEHDELIENLVSTRDDFMNLARTISESKGEFAYGTDKWSIKEVIQHMIDTERVFAYRAMRFARMDSTDLSGFEQNNYVPASKANARSVSELVEEFETLRASTINLFQSFDDSMLKAEGTANGYPFSSEAVGYITAGHSLHHTDILKERYLNAD